VRGLGRREPDATQQLLEVSDLHVTYTTDAGPVQAVAGLDLRVGAGEVVGLVGESGCGKSATALSIMALLPRNVGRVTGGSIALNGVDLVRERESALRRVRGRDVAMVFQDPMTSLNPAYTVGDQLGEPLRTHLGMSRDEAARRARELLDEVGIPQAARVAGDYPHQLSGGMRQRVVIAMAMACRPKLLIADEATTALDVTIQAQILDLLRELQQESGMGLLLISHDLGVVATTCDRVAVMYAGRMVEEAGVAKLFAQPSHPYTRGLLDSIPRLDDERARLASIPGQVPAPGQTPAGCRFSSRCSHVADRCREREPELVALGGGQASRCWLSLDEVEAR
jgi:peptide/nickel transport system ATP-binding protein